MASSKVLPSSASRNSDLRRRSSSSSTKSSSLSELFYSNNNNNQNCSHLRAKDNSSDLGSMSVDGLLRNVYGDNEASESTLLDAEITLLDAAGAVSAISDNEDGRKLAIRRQESVSNAGKKTVEDVWREIVAGRTEKRECKQEAPDEMMTLEDFLARAGAVEEEDLKMPPVPPPMERRSGGSLAFDPIPTSPYGSTSLDGVLGFGNGVEVVGGRGKRRALMEPLDKAAQQRQRRMIKNRESAARSRERKQAYQVELESLSVQLEEENARLLKEKAERMKERYKQLMERVIPITEQRRPKGALRRVRSMTW